MSLLPFFLDLDDDFYRPSHLLDQHFGLGLGPQELEFLSGLKRRPQGRYYRPWRTGSNTLARPDAGSAVVADKDKFQVCLDVQQFSPKEIAVKTVDNYVVVEGKHEEKQDEHGYISRQFVRRYALPDGHDPKEVVSNLSSDGVLTVTAPRRAAALPISERIVPITVTGPVHRSLENKEAGSGDKGKENSA